MTSDFVGNIHIIGQQINYFEILYFGSCDIYKTTTTIRRREEEEKIIHTNIEIFPMRREKEDVCKYKI